MDGFGPSECPSLVMSPESCNQGAFLIRFPEALQSVPLTSHKIKFNRAILTIILPVCSCLGGRVIEVIIFLLRIALIQNPPRAPGRIIHRWKGISEGNTTPLRS